MCVCAGCSWPLSMQAIPKSGHRELVLFIFMEIFEYDDYHQIDFVFPSSEVFHNTSTPTCYPVVF